MHCLLDILINSIEDIDSVTQSAYVDFNISFIWKDPEVEGNLILKLFYFISYFLKNVFLIIGKLWDQINWDKLWKPHVIVLNSIDVAPTLEDKVIFFIFILLISMSFFKKIK